MSTQYDIMTDIERAITSDANLSAWATTTFGRAVTVKLGNRPLKTLRPEDYPVAVVVFEPDTIEEQLTGGTNKVTEVYHIEMGVFSDNPTLAIQHMAEFERLLSLAVLFDRTRAGMAYHTAAIDRIGDGDVNHPYHFMGVKFKVNRFGPY